MFTCDLCLKKFKRKDNMLRHQKTVHDEHEDESEVELSEGDSDSDNPTDSEDEDPWDEVMGEAIEQCEVKYRDNVREYIEQMHVSEEEARKQIFDNMRSKYRKALANALTEKVLWFNDLRKSTIYKTIKRTVSSLQTENDYNEEEAWKYGINKRKYALDKVLNQYEPPELSENESSEENEQDQPNREQTGGASISRVSPAQQTVDIARIELERPFKKRKTVKDENIHVIGGKVM